MTRVGCGYMWDDDDGSHCCLITGPHVVHKCADPGCKATRRVGE